jgi:hypothetical protein
MTGWVGARIRWSGAVDLNGGGDQATKTGTAVGLRWWAESPPYGTAIAFALA